MRFVSLVSSCVTSAIILISAAWEIADKMMTQIAFLKKKNLFVENALIFMLQGTLTVWSMEENI